MVNLSHLQEYQKIFGLLKIRRLWEDFITLSEQSWQSVGIQPPEQLRLTFHSWKSSSLVFGMDDFSHHCSVIEECLLCRRHLEQLPLMIDESRRVYQHAVAEVNLYLNEQE